MRLDEAATKIRALNENLAAAAGAAANDDGGAASSEAGEAPESPS